MKRANSRLAHREEPAREESYREESEREKQHAAPANFAIFFAVAFVAILLVMFFVALISISSATVASAAVSPHGPYASNASECASCHRVHTGKNLNLLKSVAPQSNLCFTCHDGTGAISNVLAQYADPLVPQNNVAGRVTYRHDAVQPSAHTRASLNEFGGVLNRHAECGDCHNSHQANATNSTQTTTGWTSSGRLAGISGVSVVNGAAGTAPTYAFLPGGTNPITREYQLCFKCHSGFTQLPLNNSFPPSRFYLDKGVEFNPNNLSYHPIEAPGKNSTAAMILSLSGYSPYRQFTFVIGDTIRCSNCHTSSTKYNQTTPPAAGSSLSVHTSQVAGILLAPYRNRLLKPVGEAFNPAEFKLCFMCHAIGPFDGTNSRATNWTKHYGHSGTRTGTNTGGQNIDTPTANGGNAICAECHFRIHSTSYKDGTQSIPGSRLVNFSPNVFGALRTWTGSGCSGFVCHGKSH